MKRITTVFSSQSDLLAAIMELYNNGEPFEADVTYSTGRFYKTIPTPRLKYDIHPQVAGVEKADACHLPLADASLSSLVFDPPFVIKNVQRQNGHLGVIETRFSGYGTARDLYAFYRESLAEFRRVLKPGGLLVVKCMDVVSGGRQHWSEYEIMRKAFDLGFECIDKFILVSHHPIWSPNMLRQRHARKVHCFFDIFRKPRGHRVAARRPVVENERGQAA